jgi:hypothetical protein
VADSEADICNLALINIGHTKFIDALDDDTEEAEVCNEAYVQSRDEVLRDFFWPFATARMQLAALGAANWAIGTTYAAKDTVTNPTDKLVYASIADGNVGHQPDLTPASWRKISRDDWAYIYPQPGDAVQLQALVRNATTSNAVVGTPNLGGPLSGVSRVFGSGSRALREDQKVPYVREYDSLVGRIIVTDEPTPTLIYTARIEDVSLFDSDFVDALSWRLGVRLAAGLRKDAAVTRAAQAGYVAALGNATSSAALEQHPDMEADPSFIAARR